MFVRPLVCLVNVWLSSYNHQVKIIKKLDNFLKLSFIKMLDKLQTIEKKYMQLQEQAMDPSTMEDMKKYISINKELSNLKEVYDLSVLYRKNHNQLTEAKEILENESDKELISMAQEEYENAKEKIEELSNLLNIALLPKDPNDDKDVYLEIRPAAWGDEAGLFATELLKMYLGYATRKGWKSEIIDEQLSDIWWIKDVTVKISGDRVYYLMKFESWVHRVQRVPDTESQWRVHTSTVTVAIMPEAEDVDIVIDPKDIQMETYAASSAWWQNANKNQTWVRIHHKPSWLIVNIGETKSQLQNKEKAFAVLKSRLYQIELDKKIEKEKNIRWNQIWTWNRSEKIRTYNFPQDRITDHRIHQSWSNIPIILTWDLDDIMEKMVLENKTRLLQETIEN
jgi:peptide chain release factor 1